MGTSGLFSSCSFCLSSGLGVFCTLFVQLFLGLVALSPVVGLPQWKHISWAFVLWQFYLSLPKVRTKMATHKPLTWDREIVVCLHWDFEDTQSPFLCALPITADFCCGTCPQQLFNISIPGLGHDLPFVLLKLQAALCSHGHNQSSWILSESFSKALSFPILLYEFVPQSPVWMFMHSSVILLSQCQLLAIPSIFCLSSGISPQNHDYALHASRPPQILLFRMVGRYPNKFRELVEIGFPTPLPSCLIQ